MCFKRLEPEIVLEYIPGMLTGQDILMVAAIIVAVEIIVFCTSYWAFLTNIGE
jgi:hypothetical protein